MNKILLKSATLVHPDSGFNQSEVDVLIENGVISRVAKKLDIAEDETQVIQAKGKFVLPGFFDLNTNLGEPGYETREDIQTGLAAAAAGGFTGVAIQPNTLPPIHSKAEVSYLKKLAGEHLVEVYPLGCISKDREGKDLAELYDMRQAGAVAFTDGTRPVTDPGLMSRALLYTKGFNGLVFSYPEEVLIAGKGKMNEGEMSTFLGMKGIPALAEELMVARDLYLAEYNDAPIHFSTISTVRSVELIREAKRKGIKVTCDVSAHHLLFTEKDLQDFDSNYKVKPPFRTDADVAALLKGLDDGTIDAIVSQHTPHEVEFKNVEFEIANFGIIGLQTVLPVLLAVGLSVQTLVEKLAINPRRILGLPVPRVEAGELANLVLIDPSQEWMFDEHSNRSKSANSPLFNQKLKGRVVFAVNNSKVFIL